MRAVADREASRLARPEKASKSSRLAHATRSKAAVTSTPLGQVVVRSNNKSDKEEWCGPFSVARQLIEQRDEARRIREESTQMLHHPMDEIMERRAQAQVSSIVALEVEPRYVTKGDIVLRETSKASQSRGQGKPYTFALQDLCRLYRRQL
jgi:hypothetical protein